MNKFLSIGLLLAVSICIGCSEEPNASDPPDPVEMSVAVWPEDGTIDVERNVKPTYTFSVELNDEMPEISIVRKSDGATINHNIIKVSSTLYRIEFPQPLAEKETYDRYLSKAVGKNGEVLKKPLPQITSFTTKEDIVIIPPLVLSVLSPPNNSEIPDTTSTLHYHADYDLDPATVEPSFTLTNTTTGTQLNPTVDVSGKDINVDVDGLLEHSSAYTAEFDADIIRGLNGEKPTTMYSFTFTTESVYVQPPFTTPVGFNHVAGTNKDGIYYVGGMGLNDEGFTACFDWEGDSLWFNDFKINGQYTLVRRVEVNSTGVYSLVDVNPSNPITNELWLYRQSLNGEYLNKWKLSDAAIGLSITSSETDIYVLWVESQTNNHYISQYSSNGLEAEIVFSSGGSVYYINGYVYITGTGTTNSHLFFTKWQANLSDSVWYREVNHAGIFAIERSYITYAANRLWVLSVEYDQQLIAEEIMQQYDDNGTLLTDMTLPSSIPGIYGVCSDGTNAYKIGVDGLFRVDIDGNITQIRNSHTSNVFRADDPNGTNHKIAVTDGTNILKLYNR